MHAHARACVEYYVQGGIVPTKLTPVNGHGNFHWSSKGCSSKSSHGFHSSMLFESASSFWAWMCAEGIRNCAS